MDSQGQIKYVGAQSSGRDGAVIPTGPDTRCRGNVLSLFNTHTQSGIRITPKTSHSLWLGEKMDDELAILGILQLE